MVHQSPVLYNLLNILQKEVKLHEYLMSLLKKESKGFGNLRGSDLLKLQGEKSRCVRASARLESERIELVEKIAYSWDMKSEDLTLSVIISNTKFSNTKFLFKGKFFKRT